MILKDWVIRLGLRHQGCLLSAIRGCDNAEKDDPSKMFIRCYRGILLNAYCGDVKKAKSFIEYIPDEELWDRYLKLVKSLDQYPHHYVMHLIHAIEIVGYKMPNGEIWNTMYFDLCRRLHMNPETEYELDTRLNADEDTFYKAQ